MTRSIRTTTFTLALFLMLAVAASITKSQSSLVLPVEGDAIRYLAPPKDDPVAQLQQRLDRGDVQLEYAAPGGYLLSVLKQLQVSVSSQMLVFSKTSFQQYRIAPAAPRAVYFNDNAYVGWVQGGDVVELSAVDPERGAMFYTLDQRKTDKPRFIRRDECLQCHASPRTLGVPGHFVRSVFPDREGFPQLQAGSFLTDHSSPLKERWGGWYVTGTHGAQRIWATSGFKIPTSQTNWTSRRVQTSPSWRSGLSSRPIPRPTAIWWRSWCWSIKRACIIC
ncbi:MAG: hypothetical protein EXQ58_10825 [Acidobacteria bacterium]|nr:hypothetical protein [Acidobacteriota bacterium]